MSELVGDLPSCRFRLFVDATRFHCGADVNGWAFLWYSDEEYRNPCIGCQKRIKGDGLSVGRELDAQAFWKLAGSQIRSEDWATWVVL